MALITSANASVTQMNDCVSMVDEAVNSSDTAIQKMDSVVNSFQLVSDNTTNVASSADMQSKNVKSINDSTHLLQELSNEEQSNVKNEAIEMAELCEKLERQLQQFSV